MFVVLLVLRGHSSLLLFVRAVTNNKMKKARTEKKHTSAAKADPKQVKLEHRTEHQPTVPTRMVKRAGTDAVLTIFSFLDAHYWFRLGRYNDLEIVWKFVWASV